MIEAEGLFKDYRSIRALNDVTFKVGRGEIFGFFGPNGAGKTTCIKVLCGLTAPTDGSASVLDIDVARHPIHVRDNIAILSEESRFYEEMTPRKYLNMFGKFMLMGRSDRLKNINTAADLADLRGFLDQRIAQLSQGQRQRVSLARVLMADKPLVFLDEPFEGVDITHRKALRDHLRKRVEDGNTIFFTSHNLIEAEHIVDRFAFIHRGRLIAIGTAEELKEKYLAPTYSLHVSDPQKAKEMLDRGLGLQEISVVEGDVHLTLKRRSDAPQVAKILVQEGIDLFEMRTMGTMEEVFERTSRGGVS
ncbi:MAG: ABC transporter ATP-binding protein [Thermoplasmata archaeon]|jgi:ABC-2 type transport system ATP-binding protein|nr:ABC transporter ATP-binding protein [Thermoplasmata archaeon]